MRWVSFTLTQDDRNLSGQINDGGHFDTAGTGIDNKVHVALEAFANGHRVVHWPIVARQNQRRAQHRLVELLEQFLRDAMIGNAQTDRFSLRVLQALGDFSSRLKDESEASGSRRLEHAITPVVHSRVTRDFS